MTRITYQVIEHDGGWAYRVSDTISETFPTHHAARVAAKRAAREQMTPGDSASISYEDEKGVWHDEVASGSDRPEADVEG